MTLNRQAAIRKGIRVSNMIRQKISDAGAGKFRNSDRIPTDFCDIYEICCNYKAILDDLAKSEAGTKAQGRKRLLDALNLLQSELYIHLDYHFKGLKKPLERLIAELEDGRQFK